jgi:hypothetical protein
MANVPLECSGFAHSGRLRDLFDDADTRAVYRKPGQTASDLAAERRTPPIDLLYVTDRAPPNGPDSCHYAVRSRYLAFGLRR